MSKCLLSAILFSAIATAQPDTLREYFQYYPLKTGNYWEYSELMGDLVHQERAAYSVEVIGDTVGIVAP